MILHMKCMDIALVAAFNSHGELLLLRRPADVHCGDFWSLPGGKIEPGETALAAAERELREETGLSGTAWQQLGESSHTYPDRQLHFVLYACHCDDLARLRPESDTVWAPLSELASYPMPEANANLIPLLRLPAQEPTAP